MDHRGDLAPSNAVSVCGAECLPSQCQHQCVRESPAGDTAATLLRRMYSRYAKLIAFTYTANIKCARRASSESLRRPGSVLCSLGNRSRMLSLTVPVSVCARRASCGSPRRPCSVGCIWRAQLNVFPCSASISVCEKGWRLVTASTLLRQMQFWYTQLNTFICSASSSAC